LDLKFENQELEYRRIKKLSEFDLDYAELQKDFKSLADLAAMIAGTKMAVINLIDNYFQWTITSQSEKLLQMPREESICNTTMLTKEILEIPRLDEDKRFKDKDYANKVGVNYYLGVPLRLDSGENIGVLCVLDGSERKLSEKNKKMLELVAQEIVNKLETSKKFNECIHTFNELIRVKNQVAHDVRGPINGITSLAELVEADDPDRDEMKEYFRLIKDSGKSLLELTEDILGSVKTNNVQEGGYINLKQLKAKLLKLYRLPAKSKELDFQIILNPARATTAFPKRKLLSIFGNLISNSIKFTPVSGRILVKLDVVNTAKGYCLQFVVEDSGIGISPDALLELQNNKLNSTSGTFGEKGFGLGLKLVQDMVEDLKGEMNIISKVQEGTQIDVKLLLR
jgi:signal transduction histidine kinase